MITRRDSLKHSASVAGLLASTGLFPQYAWAFNKSAFDAKTVAEAVKSFGGAAPVESKDVTITGPDIAENGAAVQVGFGSSLAGVKRLALLVDKNPFNLVAVFDLGEAVAAAGLSTRIKMAESSNVYAVAFTGDGRVLYAVREIRVTLGGCG